MLRSAWRCMFACMRRLFSLRPHSIDDVAYLAMQPSSLVLPRILILTHTFDTNTHPHTHKHTGFDSLLVTLPNWGFGAEGVVEPSQGT